jgi:hypothetical protein
LYLASLEDEYQALSECVQEPVFAQNLAGVKKPAIISEDNLGTILLVKHQQVSSWMKHIDTRHHSMSDLKEKKDSDVRFKRSENNSSDIMTSWPRTQQLLFMRNTPRVSGTALWNLGRRLLNRTPQYLNSSSHGHSVVQSLESLCPELQRGF